jgi:hypothetical protein
MHGLLIMKIGLLHLSWLGSYIGAQGLLDSFTLSRDQLRTIDLLAGSC